MKKILLISWFVITCFAVNATAALVDNGDGTITDTDTNLMWLKDANYAFTLGSILFLAGGSLLTGRRYIKRKKQGITI